MPGHYNSVNYYGQETTGNGKSDPRRKLRYIYSEDIITILNC